MTEKPLREQLLEARADVQRQIEGLRSARGHYAIGGNSAVLKLIGGS